MILTRRKFILTTGSALAGAVFVPKFERWFGRYDDKPVMFFHGFRVTQEMLEDDMYTPLPGVWLNSQELTHTTYHIVVSLRTTQRTNTNWT